MHITLSFIFFPPYFFCGNPHLNDVIPTCYDVQMLTFFLLPFLSVSFLDTRIIFCVDDLTKSVFSTIAFLHPIMRVFNHKSSSSQISVHVNVSLHSRIRCLYPMQKVEPVPTKTKFFLKGCHTQDTSMTPNYI